jgi:hypothetical protein
MATFALRLLFFMLYFHFDQVDVECVAQRLNHDATNG